MAIAFARVSIHSRAKGHSAVAAASYRAGIKLIDSRTGITHDYSRRHDVVYSEILLPKGASHLFQDRTYLWNAVESAEKRKDAQVCKDVVLALPKELDLTYQIELTQQFVQTHFIAHGLPADISIHHHDENPHAHILIPTRRVEQTRFSTHKARDLNPVFAKGLVIENDYWGERWREAQETFFVEKGLDLSVDVNHIISERHHGNKGDYLRYEKHLIQQSRYELVMDNVEHVIHHLSQQHSVFTRRDVERLLFKTFSASSKAEDYLGWVEKVLSHKEIIVLGENDKGQTFYTTRTQYILESRLRSDINKLMRRQDHIYSSDTDALAQQFTLSDEQHEALHYITQGKDISVIIGRPGVGKSYLLNPVKTYYDQHQCHIIGASLSGKVAKAMQTETGIPSSTIASLVYRLEQKQLQLTKKHVIVIDEAGMVDVNNMAYLINQAKKSGSKIILIGDPDQLKPIHKGEIFRGIAAITGYIELENIKRQQSIGDRQASLHLAKGQVGYALDHYADKQAVFFLDNPVDQLIVDWQCDKDTLLLSYTRKSVAMLNERARALLKENDDLGQEEIVIETQTKGLPISRGERLLFKQNDRTLGVRNGDLATVKDISPMYLGVQLDSGECLIIPKNYKAIDYGYALTVHKSQGITAENVKVFIDSSYWNKNLAFVAMTRHKKTLTVYSDRTIHSNLNDLKQTLSRVKTNLNVIDWPLDFATRIGLDPDKLLGKVINLIAETSVHRRINDKTKTPISLIAEYNALVKQQKHMTGYYREKMDKKLQSIASELCQCQRLNKLRPDTAKQIKSQNKDSLQCQIERD